LTKPAQLHLDWYFFSNFNTQILYSMISPNSVSIVTDEIWLCFVQVRENFFLFEGRVCSDEFVNFWNELCPTCVSVLEYSERRDVNVHEVVAFVAWALE